MDTGSGQYRNLVRYAEPARDGGKLVLLNASNMWFYDPASKASVRISPQQRLTGQASQGDVLTVNLGHDYTAAVVGEETVKDSARAERTAWHLDLKAATADAQYSRLEYWVEKGTFHPIKAKLYSDSGRLLKVAYYGKYASELGPIAPRRRSSSTPSTPTRSPRSGMRTVRNDLREAYATWEPAPGTFLEAGRINVRNGAALGFNPTDFFKPRTLVGQASLDPSVVRQNRLGALLVRTETLWKGGSASVAWAPKLSDPTPISAPDPLGLDPRFDATNAANRISCTLGFEVADLSPQLLGYFELHRSKIGVNVTRPIGDAVVVYAEWTGGPEASLPARAIAYGQSTGTIPLAAPVLPPSSTSRVFTDDLAVGASWTFASLTLNLEYHLHQGGLTAANWRSWFDLGGEPGAPDSVAGELWYVRGYASDQQEPATQHQAFARLSWPRALTPDLELSAIAFVDLLDGSVLAQTSASYYLSSAWTLAAFGSVEAGASRSEWGSTPQLATVALQIVRYQ